MTRTEEKAKWRPWRFSLRFLLLVMFGVATFCGGWVANDWHRNSALNAAVQPTPNRIGGAMRETKVMRMHDPVLKPKGMDVMREGPRFYIPRNQDKSLINDLSK